MGASSQYTSVPQSDDTGREHRPAEVRARDFLHPHDAPRGTASAADEEEDPDVDDGFGLTRRRGRNGSSSSSRRQRRDEERRRPLSWYTLIKRTVYLVVLVTLALALGFCAGSKHQQMRGCGSNSSSSAASSSSGHEQQQLSEGGSSSLLPPQSLVPEIPMKGVKFGFPTPYEDTGIEGDKLWDALMPLGSGFIRVPYPRKYDMPASKPIEDDPEEAEIYSLSSLHQIHCLAVIRDVIKHYQAPDPEEKGPSRFAGHGHEWHCVDYLRQAVMCAGDTTLDFAEPARVDPATGTVVGASRGFTGDNSTHQCRDWDAMVAWAVEERAGDRKSIT